MHISRFYPAGVGNNIENGPSSPAKNRTHTHYGKKGRKKNPFVVREMHLTVLGTATTNNKNRKRKKTERDSLYWTIKSHWMKRGCRLLRRLPLLLPLFLSSFFFFFYYIEVVVVVVVASERTSFAKPAPVTSSRTERRREHCRYWIISVSQCWVH